MKRLKLLIVIFILALTLPLGFMVYSTHRSLEQEELAELRYFADALFDRIERELEVLVLREEQRPVDDYTAGFNPGRDALNQASYMVGYIQNNPDGTFLTPSVPGNSRPKGSGPQKTTYDELSALNVLFNQLRGQTQGEPEPSAEAKPLEDMPPKPLPVKQEQYPPSTFSNRYYQTAPDRQQKVYLGRKDKRMERITRDQALNMSQNEWAALPPPSLESLEATASAKLEPTWSQPPADLLDSVHLDEEAAPSDAVSGGVGRSRGADLQGSFHVEVDPLQSVMVSDHRIFIFRRIVIGSQVFRQGFVLNVPKLLTHLSESYFKYQPMARFTELHLWVADDQGVKDEIRIGRHFEKPQIALAHTFPRPFSFLQAGLAADRIPPSEGRQTLNVMVVVLAAIILIGLLAIYHSARVVVDLSEKRTGFVSSVTHELKTPLTNIRLYIEMLENGIAVDPEREQEYYRILGSETARLSRLINNVLEFSKLEKKQRPLNIITGDLTDVLTEVESVMREKLRQDGFSLDIQHEPALGRYDREAMVQVLINLLENSIKFSTESQERCILLMVNPHRDKLLVRVSDTGPGIPRQSLKKIFDNFYRVDNSLTRRTKGTGIGLALVKKLVTGMGGTVSAANNPEHGCTITVALPRVKEMETGH